MLHGKLLKQEYQKQRGFTLAELLVAVAIVGILTAISIPIFSLQLEKSREATDMANVRNAYAEVMIAINSGDNINKTVYLKQKQDGWQTNQESHKIMIGGITEDNKKNWIGNPIADGTCKVYYDKTAGLILQWSKEFTDLQTPFIKGKLLEYIQNTYGTNVNFEIDSGCTNSKMVGMINEWVGKDTNRNDLMECGTWAYMGSVKQENDKNRYLFWTSVDINQPGFKVGKDIPMIISTADGKYYISHSKTAVRSSNNQTYNVIIDKTSISGYKKYIPKDSGYSFNTLTEAYDAYTNFVKNQYQEYENTLPY